MMMKRYILLTLIALTLTAARAQERVMTIDEVDSLVTSNNLQLKASLLEVDAARAQLQQACKYDNPELLLMHNLQNPVNRKWLDTGHDGQTDIQFSQPLAIGGQHRSRVRQAQAALNADRANHDATVIDIRYDARTTFVDLHNVQQKLRVYAKEIASVERIHQAYAQQEGKGNVSRMQVFRIGAMLCQLRQEMAGLQLDANDLQQRLILLLNLNDDATIQATMDADAQIASVADHLARLQPLATGGGALMQSLVEQHPGMAQARYEEEGARHAVRAEKADALPRIALNGEWDKNGSIGHNFFAVGATVSLPLWNRNQGNIRAAKAQQQQAAIESQQRERQLQSSLQTHYRATASQLRLVEDQRQLAIDLDSLIQAAEEQFLKRHIPVVEFVDLYSSFRETLFLQEDARAQLLKSNEELKKYTR